MGGEVQLRAGESGTTVLFSTHIVSDLERVASHVACLHLNRLVINTSMDELKETHALLQLNAEAAARLPIALPGELSRRRRADGGLSILLVREVTADWPIAGHESGAQLEALNLEDLLIELTA